MRPPSIVKFERLVLLGIALGILSTFLVWDKINAQVAQTGMGAGGLIGTQVVMTVLYLVLLWFISRNGSPVAKWIYVVLAGLSLVFGLVGIAATFALGTVSGIIAIIQYALIAASLWLLFRPDAKAWFAEGRGGADA